VAELAIRTIDCGIVATAALGYGGPWLWRAVRPITKEARYWNYFFDALKL